LIHDPHIFSMSSESIQLKAVCIQEAVLELKWLISVCLEMICPWILLKCYKEKILGINSNKNYVYVDMKSRLKLGNVCCYSVWNLLSFHHI